MCRSPGARFSVFSPETDVLVFYGLLWNLEAMWIATCSPEVSSGIHAIEQMFTSLGQEVETHPRLWMEIVSVRALQPEKFAAMGTRDTDQIPEVERLIRFPGLPGIESIPEGNFRQFSCIISTPLSRKKNCRYPRILRRRFCLWPARFTAFP